MGRGDPGLKYGTLDVAGVRRGYWLALGPGGPQYLPARMVGPIPRQLDATGILLETVRADSRSGVSDDAAAPPG